MRFAGGLLHRCASPTASSTDALHRRQPARDGLTLCGMTFHSSSLRPAACAQYTTGCRTLRSSTAETREVRRARARELARPQCGVVSRRQLYALGVTRWAVTAEVRAG